MTVKPSGPSSAASLTKYILTAALDTESATNGRCEHGHCDRKGSLLRTGWGPRQGRRHSHGAHKRRSRKDLLALTFAEQREHFQCELDSAIYVDLHMPVDISSRGGLDAGGRIVHSSIIDESNRRLCEGTKHTRGFAWLTRQSHLWRGQTWPTPLRRSEERNHQYCPNDVKVIGTTFTLLASETSIETRALRPGLAVTNS